MAWSIDTLRQFTLFLIRKNQSAGITFSEFQNVFNAEQRTYMNDLLGPFQQQQRPKSVSQQTGLIQNETIIQKLSPFIKPYDLPIVSSKGYKPGDFIYEMGMRIDAYRATRVNHDQIYAAENDVIDPPDASAGTYYFTEYLNYFMFLPAGLTKTGKLDYVGEPTDAIWAYTINAYGRQIYDPVNSVQPLWDGISLVEIVKRSLRMLGVSFKDDDFEQFAEGTIVTGD